MKKYFLKAYRHLVMMLALTAVAVTVSCSDDDDPTPPLETPEDIVAVAIANGYNVLAAAVTEAGLVETLQGDGPFTVFAPTDEAFAEAGITAANVSDVPDADLTAILTYHVIPARVLSTQLTTGPVGSVEGSDLTIDAENLTVNGISIVAPFDVEASNGVIHTIDGVLTLPEEEPEPTESIVALAQGNEDLSILVDALTKFPDLVDALDSEGTYTVFAPTNQAFVDLLGVVGQTGLDDIPEAVIRRLLEYHVINGTAALSSSLTDGQTIPTLLETGETADEVTVGIEGQTVTINNSTVETADLAATNGVVHVIDAVLVPALEGSIVNTVVEPAYFNVNFTTLTTAVVEAGLLEALTDEQSTLTLFAPTNDAFDALLERLGITATDLLASEDLVSTLEYHALGQIVASENLTDGFVETLNGAGIYVNTEAVTINNVGFSDFDIAADNGVVHVINEVLLPGTIGQVALDNDFTVLATALETAGLIDAVMDPTADLTVFAPTDAAFSSLLTRLDITAEDLLANEDLADILLYHVLAGSTFAQELDGMPGLYETLLEQDVLIDIAGETGTINNVNISLFDVEASNGVVHVIDEVILPNTLAAIASNNNFSILVEAVVEAGLLAAIMDPTVSYTIFAPTDAAFAAYLEQEGITAEQLLASDILGDVLLYHILPAAVFSTDIQPGEQTAATLLEQDLTIDGTNLTVDQAGLEVDLLDLEASNGVIHGIDAVLVPTLN